MSDYNFENAHFGGKNVDAGAVRDGGLAHIDAPVFVSNTGERSTSPVSPSIAIPERRYTPKEQDVLAKFVHFVRIKDSNDKPYLDENEKNILRSIYYLRESQDLLQQALRQLGIRKEQANLDKNYEKMLKRKPGYPNSRSRRRSRRRNRKTRKL